MSSSVNRRQSQKPQRAFLVWWAARLWPHTHLPIVTWFCGVTLMGVPQPQAF